MWPHSFVEEGNLSQGIFVLRRKLGQTSDGQDYIQPVPRRGYRFGVSVERVARGEDGALIKVLLAEAQFDPELAKALRERWTMPRRRMAFENFREGVRQGVLRSDMDPDAMIDLLYAPLYYRLQMGTGPLSDSYVDEIFEHGMKGLEAI